MKSQPIRRVVGAQARGQTRKKTVAQREQDEVARMLFRT